MKKIECSQIKECIYTEKLENGLELIIIPKKNIRKKYAIIGTKFGSIDNRFINNNEEIFIPDGVAHFLEHKMFEQSDGTNSLDTLMALGIDANAYTTNDHTAYLIECTDHFDEGLTELMNYVQHPYFTIQNVEKEKGIIGQEIMMYDDDPSWQLYINAMDCLYKTNPIKIDIAGSIESIAKITPDVLNKCYNTFYNPTNMVFVLSGDFEPEELLKKIKANLVEKPKLGKITRIYPQGDNNINIKSKEKKMDISMPIFMIGYKDKIVEDKKELIKRQIAIEIILNKIIGESSELYANLYKEGKLLSPLDIDYEFSSQYAHVLISGQSNYPKQVKEKIAEEIVNTISKGINEQELERNKKKIYGDYVKEYNSVSDTAKMFLSDWMKGINSFDYIEEFQNVNTRYVEQILKEVFDQQNMVISVVK